MNDMNVPKTGMKAPQAVLEDLASELEELTPELRKAASYVLENPNDVGVSSIREIADAAGVKPNTFVRMARSVGFDGYEDFRQSVPRSDPQPWYKTFQTGHAGCNRWPRKGSSAHCLRKWLLARSRTSRTRSPRPMPTR